MGSDLVFKDLMPVDSIDSEIIEIKMMKQFIIDEDKVRNIGIVGPYSSGKSSLINSFIKTNEIEKEVKIISLAKINSNILNVPIENNREEHNVEIDVLQQLLLSKTNNKRMVRGLNILFWGTMFVLFSVVIFLILDKTSVLYVKYSQSFSKTVKILSDIISVFILPIIIVLLIIIILKNNLIKKLEVSKVNLELEERNISLVDKNMKVIVQNLVNSKIKYYIFEDLDRYSKTNSVLVKLKEINMLVNSKRYKDPIKFIYAISESTFDSVESKVKFLDAIVPTSAVLTSEGIKNINDILKLDLNNDVSHIISKNINDMRVLHSIYNDYIVIYNKHKNINNDDIELQRDFNSKVFILAAYKNLYPEDYHNIFSGKSLIHKIFEKKEALKISEKNDEWLNKSFKELGNKYSELIKSDISIYITSHYRSLNKVNETLTNAHTEFLHLSIINGYIDEMFEDVLYSEDERYFKNKNDREFFYSVISKIPKDITFELTNIEKITKNLSISHYNNLSIINMDLIKYHKEKNDEQKLSQINQTIIKNPKIIKEILLNDKIIDDERFIYKLIDGHGNIIDSILSVDNIKQDLYLSLAIATTKYELSSSEEKYLKSFTIIANSKDVETFLTNDEMETLINKFKNLNMKIKELSINSKVVEKIYENSLFEINKQNIDNYMNNVLNSSEHQENQLTTLYSKKSTIKDYIEKNFSEYLESAWLKETRVENEETTLRVLNSTAIPQEYKMKYINHVESKITNITEINPYNWSIRQVVPHLINQHKINYTLSNVMYLYQTGYVKYGYIEEIEVDNIDLINDSTYQSNIFYSLVNAKKLDVDKLLEITPKNLTINYEKIENEDLLVKYIEDKTLDITRAIMLQTKLKIMEKLYKKLVESDYELFSSNIDDYLIDAQIGFTIKETIKNNDTQNFNKLINTYSKIVITYYEFNDQIINEKLIKESNKNKFNNEIILNYTKKTNDYNLFINQVRNNFATKDDMLKIFAGLDGKYKDIGEEPIEVGDKEFNEKLRQVLKEKRLINANKVRNQDKYKISINK